MKKLLFTAVLSMGIYFSNAQLTAFSVGQTAPNFTVTDLHGNSQSLYTATAAGKYVLLDFYAYWCGPCCSTAPYIKDFYLKYGCNAGDVYVLGLEYEGTTAQTEGFETSCLPGVPNTYPTAAGVDGGAAAVHATYGPAAFPTIVLIDPTNKFVNIDIWPISSVGNIEAAFPAGSITPMACATSVETILNDQSLAVYPSPASYQVTLALNLAENAAISYNIINNLGEVIMTNALGSVATINQTINVNGLENGAYIMQVIANGEQTKAVQFMVAH